MGVANLLDDTKAVIFLLGLVAQAVLVWNSNKQHTDAIKDHEARIRGIEDWQAHREGADSERERRQP